MKENLIIRTGTEGPKHEPYAYTEYTVFINEVEHTLHLGLAVGYSCNKKEIAYGDKAVPAFEQATGVSYVQMVAEEEEQYSPKMVCPCCGAPTVDAVGMGSEPVVYCENKACTEPYFWSHPEPWKFCE